MVEVVPVTNNRLRKAFIKAPWPIYKGDPAWRPPLLAERRMALSPREPIFEHLQWRAWLAQRKGRTLGRISAQIDALHQDRYGDATGFFGLLEGEDDPQVFSALFAAAEGWLRDQGMRRVVGPLNLNINQEVGMLADGYDRPPFFLMGHARPYYHPRIEALGYQPCQSTLAYACPTIYDEPPAAARLRRRLSKRLLLRPLERTRKAAELALIRDIFNDAWTANWGFVPFTEAEFKALGEALLLVTPPDLVWMAELEGEAVGFIAMIPNINEAIHDLNGRLLPFGWLKLLWRLKVRGVSSGRVPLMGVRRRLQDSPLGGGVAMSLIHECGKAALRHGITSTELSWILEDNQGMHSIIERIGGRVSKRYLLYAKPLAPGAQPSFADQSRRRSQGLRQTSS